MRSSIELAKQAAARGAWEEARALLAGVDDAELSPDDLEVRADAAWWCCRIDDAIAARRLVYDAHLAAGDARRAGYTAWLLSRDHGIRSEDALSSGWLQRAQRHLSSAGECAERGFLAVTESDVARGEGDLERARESAQTAIDLGERCGSLDLHAMGLQTLGRVLIAGGDLRGGLALLDEAMALTLGGRLGPMFTGDIYCNVVATVMEHADLARAREWTDAALAWCGSIATLTPYHGICRLHGAEITALSGDWPGAEAEALRTVEEMQGLEQHVAAEALSALGDIALRRGDLNEAEAWFERAHALGHDPQPGRSLVRLAQGKADAAAAGLRVSLHAPTLPPFRRARLLAAQVEVALAAHDDGTADAAADALDELAATEPAPLLAATAAAARAAVRLARGQPEDALRNAVQAWSLWQRLRLPYEAAKARVLVGLASAAAGDEARAQAELEAARATFEGLGAKLDARAVAEQLRGTSELPGGLSRRELEVLRLLAEGRTDREIAASMVISEHTVSRHLHNIYRKLDVSSRAAATAFAYEHNML